MKVRFKRLTANAVTPTRQHASDAGYDLTATSRKVDDNGCVVFGTGIAVEIPSGFVGLVFPRSSIAKKDLLLTNSVGVIDSGYRGEILCKFKPIPPYLVNENKQVLKSYHVGDRIVQLLIMPIPDIEFEEADELHPSDRGDGAYGSTGK